MFFKPNIPGYLRFLPEVFLFLPECQTSTVNQY